MSLDVDPICRLCLLPSPMLSSLLLENRAQMLEALTSIKVSQSDPSTHVCVKCVLSLKLAYKICQNMKDNDEKLRKMWAETGQEIVDNSSVRNGDTEDNFTDDNFDDAFQDEITIVTGCPTNCMVCGEDLSSKDGYEHLKSHFKDNNACKYCTSIFAHASGYADHLLTDHFDQEYKCEKPDLATPHEPLIEVHMNTADAENSEKVVALPASKEIVQIEAPQEGPFVCKECGKVLFTKGQFRCHTHVKKQCPMCYKLVGVRNLRRHIECHRVTGKMGELRKSKNGSRKYSSSGEAKYKCDKCDRAYKREAMRDLHIKRDHEGNVPVPKKIIQGKGPFVCEECDKIFSTRAQFRCHTHVKRPCPICSKLLGERNLRRHVECHTDLGKMCDLCGKKFKNSDGLRTHIYYSHMASRYKCDRCDRVFKRKFQRAVHIKRDHEDSPLEFVCDICGKKFLAIRNLTIHRKTHRASRPSFPCEFCEKRLASKKSLQTHIRKHTFEAPFKCEFCTESFRLKVSLKTHQRSKHKIEEVITCHCKTCGKGFETAQAMMVHARKESCFGQRILPKEEPQDC